MMDLVDAKLLGLWAPREGQKTDAMFMTKFEIWKRQFEAHLMHSDFIAMELINKDILDMLS